MSTETDVRHLTWEGLVRLYQQLRSEHAFAGQQIRDWKNPTIKDASYREALGRRDELVNDIDEVEHEILHKAAHFPTAQSQLKGYASCRKHTAEALDYLTPGNTERTNVELRVVGLDELFKCSCGRQAVFFLREQVIR